MKKHKTSSCFIWVIETKNNKFIRRYKRKGLHGYPRTVPLRHIAKLLEGTNILYPRFYRNRRKYIEEEFVENTKEINKEKMIDTIIFYITEMYKVNCKNIEKFIKWKNNSEYLKFQIENLEKLLTERKCNELNKNIKLLDDLIVNLDDNRKLSLIHGDIHAKNMIINDVGIYLIDWELATCGDVAYELATHFILMQYDEKEKEYFVDELCKKIPINKDNLINDMNVYNKFENMRRKLLQEISRKK